MACWDCKLLPTDVYAGTDPRYNAGDMLLINGSVDSVTADNAIYQRPEWFHPLGWRFARETSIKGHKLNGHYELIAMFRLPCGAVYSHTVAYAQRRARGMPLLWNMLCPSLAKRVGAPMKRIDQANSKMLQWLERGELGPRFNEIRGELRRRLDAAEHMAVELKDGSHQEWFYDDGGYVATISGPYAIYTSGSEVIEAARVDIAIAKGWFVERARQDAFKALRALVGDWSLPEAQFVLGLI